MTSPVVSASASSSNTNDAKENSTHYLCRLDTICCFTCKVFDKSDDTHVFTIDKPFRSTAYLTMLDPSGNKLYKIYKLGETINISDVLSGGTVMTGHFKGFFNPKLVISKKC